MLFVVTDYLVKTAGEGAALSCRLKKRPFRPYFAGLPESHYEPGSITIHDSRKAIGNLPQRDASAQLPENDSCR